ncbi:ROK family transcriptional regulator [Oceanivirga salmonicida]|uniref:ROK family transcriptional regulator n=1 Tax=Oceanivirga salmonicida TaxID=1769291 RepID=UPI0012E1990F|nr:ROK family transcriptional regulator [Oceanivirga salmonicida]
MRKNIVKLNENEYKILDLILKNNEITSLELAKNLNVSPAAISKILKKLRKEEYIFEKEEVKNIGKGRPRKIMSIKNDIKMILGVNFGADFIDISIGKLDGSIIETKRKKFFMKKKDSLVDLLLTELDSYFEKYDKNDIVGIGLALNGIIDSENRNVIFSPYFKWSNFKIGELVEERYNIPTMIDNDVRAMLNAEILFGKAKKMGNIFYLYMKNGIGSSMLIDGKIYKGSNNQAGEIGHFIINKNSNFACKCGKVGCIETEFSENSIKLMVHTEYEKLGQYIVQEDINIVDIYENAKKGNEVLAKIVSNISYKVGETVGNVMNVLDIKDIIVSGDIVHSGEIFKVNFEKGIKSSLTENFCSKINLHLTELGDNAEKYGALSLVMNNLFANLKLIK